MKKVLSVLLAAAMVMGMSVASFADYTWGAKGDNHDVGIVNEKVYFENMIYVVRDGKLVEHKESETEISLEPGDDIYFKLLGSNGTVYTGEIDADWSINIKGNKYVQKASFVELNKDFWTGCEKGQYVKVELVDNLDETADKEVSFRLYLADAEDKDAQVGDMIVNAKFANIGIKEVSFTRTNDADEAAVWKVAKNAKAGTATFDFDDDVYFTVKMVSDEKVTLNLDTSYVKAVDKLFDYDADLSFYNFKGTKDAFTKVGELFIPADEDTYIYEIVDGELVEVEAKWTDEYTITDVVEEYEGWVIKTNELGFYVVSDIEGEVAEAEDNTNSSTSTDKTNPETGANDFVGAAVALAVVSVAAAGALAFKK